MVRPRASCETAMRKDTAEGRQWPTEMPAPGCTECTAAPATAWASFASLMRSQRDSRATQLKHQHTASTCKTADWQQARPNGHDVAMQMCKHTPSVRQSSVQATLLASMTFKA